MKLKVLSTIAFTVYLFTVIASGILLTRLDYLTDPHLVDNNTEIADADPSFSGSDAYKDNFEVLADADSGWAEQEFANNPINQNDVLGKTTNVYLGYTNVVYNLPLQKKDYYYRKYENGRAGANEINRVPTLQPGSRISLIANGYITVSRKRGYVQPPHYAFGSGLCWSTSALGGMMDVANSKFNAKYGMPLFVFGRGDRAPHSHWYATYLPSNNGRGYTVIKMKRGGQDYRFTVNPNISSIPGMSDLKLDIIMTSQTDYPGAYKGQAIGAKLVSNKDF